MTCTEWIDGKEYVFGEIEDSMTQNCIFRNEIKCYKKLNQLFGIADPIQLITHQPPFKFLQTKYKCDLLDLLKNKVLSSQKKVNVCKTIMEILGKLSLRGIQHRDIKPENILMTKLGQPKVTDLGLMLLSNPYIKIPENFSEEQRHLLESKMGLLCSPDKFNEGVSGYTPPELEVCTQILKNKKAEFLNLKFNNMKRRMMKFKISQILPILKISYNTRDMFALGVLILDVLTDYKIIGGLTHNEYMSKIIRSETITSLSAKEDYFSAVRKKVYQYLDRIKLSMNNDNLLLSIFDLTYKLLEPNPLKRLNSKGLLLKLYNHSLPQRKIIHRTILDTYLLKKEGNTPCKRQMTNRSNSQVLLRVRKIEERLQLNKEQSL